MTYSDHSLAQLGVYVGKGIGFDAVHAAGCLVFALALGPAMIHSLEPVRHAAAGDLACRRARLPRAWSPMLASPAELAAGWRPARLEGRGGARADHAGRLPAGRPERRRRLRLRARRRPPRSSTPAGPRSAWPRPAINPQDVARGGAQPDRLHPRRPGLGHRPRLARADDPGRCAPPGSRPASFGGRDLVGALERDIRPDGSVSEPGQLDRVRGAGAAGRRHRAAGRPRSAGWCASRTRDGGFNFATRGGSSDADDTGAALEALAGSGGSAAARARAARSASCAASRTRTGALPACPGAGSNAQSTALAVQGLLAAGVDPALGAPRRRLAARLPALADRRRRPRALFARDRSDAGVGHRRGADGARAASRCRWRRSPAGPRPGAGRRRRPATAPAGTATPSAGSIAARRPADPAVARAAPERRDRRHRRRPGRLAGYAGVLTALALATVGAS